MKMILIIKNLWHKKKKNERITEDALGAVQYLNLYNSILPPQRPSGALFVETTIKTCFLFDMVLRMVMIALSISLAID